MCADWPMATRRGETASKEQGKTAGATKHERPECHTEDNPKWDLRAWHWEFDGEFQRKTATLSISVEAGPNTESGIPINTLGIFPLKYATDATFKQLQRRGRSFWTCRKRALVSYRGDADTNDSNLVSSVCRHLLIHPMLDCGSIYQQQI